ncbi:JmjC domain-containing protein [Streptomyces sp. NPDC014986]|uniref:JmjC domain-containing protein n=1 Tax=Streptomyces sp. NPDC014986 TaxID=3364934 RepID=UPI0036F6D943
MRTRAADPAGDFSDLFSPHALEEPLSGGLRTSSPRLVRDGVEGDVTRGCVAESGDAPGTPPFPDTDGVRHALASGQTLIVRSLHRFHPPIRRFAHELAAEIGHPVKVNAFVTPPGSQGVDLHFDVQYVLVLQIAGDTRWLLRTPPLPDPLPAHAWFDVPARRREEMRAAGRPLADLVLRAGDSLYLPRGTMHSPMARNTLSIHLTVAASTITRHDLLAELVRKAVDDDWMRVGIDTDGLVTDPELARDLLREAGERLAALAAGTDPEDVLWALRKAAFREQTPEPVPFLPMPEGVRPQGVHRLRAGVYFHTASVKDGVQLSVGNRRVRLPVSVSPFLTALHRDQVADMTGLTAALGEDNARKVVAALVDIGLLLPPSAAPWRATTPQEAVQPDGAPGGESDPDDS